jgi:hypothetical protein
MDEKTRNQIMIGGAIVAILIAAFVIARMASTPNETISTQPVPAKGIDAGMKQ